MALGLHYEKKPAPVGDVATLTNQDGMVVARILLDTAGAICSCEWPVTEGKCVHLLLMQQEEGKKLVPEWPEGRKGKLWHWQPA